MYTYILDNENFEKNQNFHLTIVVIMIIVDTMQQRSSWNLKTLLVLVTIITIVWLFYILTVFDTLYKYFWQVHKTSNIHQRWSTTSQKHLVINLVNITWVLVWHFISWGDAIYLKELMSARIFTFWWIRYSYELHKLSEKMAMTLIWIWVTISC